VSRNAKKMNGAELALINMRLEGVVRKMGSTLLRTGRSGVLNRARDFSCCIVTADCELLTAAQSLPIHVLSGPDLMAASLVEYHGKLKQGDAFLHNSPYHGCSHPADHTILVPVFDAEGRHRYTVMAKAHQADIGNAIPTTYDTAASDVYAEGALIFPAVKVQSDFKSIDDILRMCMMRIRVPEQWRGDFLAMIAAARIGESELMLLGDEYGWPLLEEFSSGWFDYSEQRMVEALGALPARTVVASVSHDAMPGVTDKPIPIQAVVSTDPERGRIEVDLRDNPDCQANGLNLSEACARTAAMIGVFNSIELSVPKNAGSFRCIDVHLRENCIAGIPRHPTSCSAATTNISDRVTNSVQLAMSQLGDGIGMAEIGANLPPSRGVFSGVDPRNQKPFINQVFLGSSGGAGGPLTDGWFHYSHAGNGGMGYMDSIEQAELYQPVIVHRRAIVPDSEGAGRTSGAPAKVIELSPVGCEITIAYAADGVENSPTGARGGMAGMGAAQTIQRQDGTKEIAAQSGLIKLAEGESLISRTCAGGGYGLPSERNPAKVMAAVRAGAVSRERAREIYGVELTNSYDVDQDATNLLRRKLASRAQR